MRVLSTWLVAVVAALSIAGCSGGSSSSSASDQSGATSSASDTGAASSDTSSDTSSATSTATEASPASGAAASTDIPSYPGAATEAAGSNMGMGGAKMASGKVMTTADSFDKVYAWYQKNMPAGSEKAHTTAPIQTAVFMLGEAGKDQQSVTISVASGKTTITIAKVKM